MNGRLVRSIGADQAVDYTVDDFAGGADRYDVNLDTAGNRPLRVRRRALAPRGTLVIVGGEGGGRWLGGFDRQILRAPLLSIVGRRRMRAHLPKERSDDLVALAELVEAGKVTPVIDRTFALRDAAEAIRYLHAGHARGKVVVTVAGSA